MNEFFNYWENYQQRDDDVEDKWGFKLHVSDLNKIVGPIPVKFRIPEWWFCLECWCCFWLLTGGCDWSLTGGCDEEPLTGSCDGALGVFCGSEFPLDKFWLVVVADCDGFPLDVCVGDFTLDTGDCDFVRVALLPTTVGDLLRLVADSGGVDVKGTVWLVWSGSDIDGVGTVQVVGDNDRLLTVLDTSLRELVFVGSVSDSTDPENN